ncbi:hypothetical protein ACFL43_04000 [Thermodesulfobacteriota bacterium]
MLKVTMKTLRLLCLCLLLISFLGCEPEGDPDPDPAPEPVSLEDNCELFKGAWDVSTKEFDSDTVYEDVWIIEQATKEKALVVVENADYFTEDIFDNVTITWDPFNDFYATDLLDRYSTMIDITFKDINHFKGHVSEPGFWNYAAFQGIRRE